MAYEIWLWLKEKFAAAMRSVLHGVRFLWLRFLAYLGTVRASTWRIVVAGIPLLFILYILLAMPLAHRVEDDLAFSVSPAAGAAHTPALVAALVDREVREHDWRVNDPFFQPGWWLDNTPNFQRGLMGALSRFSFELRDQVGRLRGSSAVDADLEKAAGNLAKEPDRWIVDFGTSLLPTTPSDTYFKEAARNLRAYNKRLARGEAVFERRSDNLLSTLDRMAIDLGASSAAADAYIAENSGGLLPDFGVDDLFYQIKGQLYGYYLITKALRQDYADVVRERDLAPLFDALDASLAAGAALDPILVTNGGSSGILANHLSLQGFYLLRARTQLREITNILLK